MARNKSFNTIATLKKAMNLFWLKGYEATSIDDLCEVMGIKRGSLYNAFGDKRTLFFRTLELYTTPNGNQVFSPDSGESALAAIHALFDTAIDVAINGNDIRGCLIVNTTIEMAATDKEVAQYCDNQRENYEAMFYNLLVIAEENNEIKSGQDLQAMAQYLVNAFYGLRVTTKLTREDSTLKNIVSMTLSTIQ